MKHDFETGKENFQLSSEKEINQRSQIKFDYEYICKNNYKIYGKILDLGCFPKGTLILNGSFEQVPIETLKIGDKVITHKGNICKIITTFKRKSNNMISLNCALGFSVKATPEHPILAIKIPD